MKKKSFRGLIPLLFLLMLLVLSSYCVSAAEVTIIDWEDSAVGATSGSSDYVNWFRLVGDDFSVQTERDVVSGNALRLQDDALVSDVGYVWLSHNYSFINTTKFYLDTTSYCYEYAYVEFQFYNDNNTVTSDDDYVSFKLRYTSDYVAGVGREHWYYYDNSASGLARLFCTTASSSDREWLITVTLNTTGAVGSRCVDYNVTNLDDGLGSHYARNVSDAGYNTWDYIKILAGSDGGDSQGYVKGWLDDIIIDGVNVGDSETDVVTEYIDIFGDFFIEFYNYDENCYYYNGDHPVIVWNVSSVYAINNNFYHYQIINKFGNVEGEGYINRNTNGVLQLEDYSFAYSGSYYIVMWNMTSDFEDDAYIEYSRTIFVCNDDDSVDDDDDPWTIDSSGYDQYVVAGAFFALIGVSVAVAMFTGMWQSFPFVMFGGMIALSVPGTFMTLFPPVVLLLSGLVLILLIMVFYIRR